MNNNNNNSNNNNNNELNMNNNENNKNNSTVDNINLLHSQKTLLDLVENSYNSFESARCSRALVLVDIKNGINEVENFHQSFCKNTNKEEFTGVLLVLNNQVLVHLIETSTSNILKLLRFYQDYKGIENSCVVSLTEEVIREYPIWAQRSLNVANQDDVIVKDFAEASFGILKNLLELGRELALKPSKALDYIKNAKNQLLPRVPSVELVSQCTASQELFSVADFLEAFDQPVELPLESELVWPIERLHLRN